MATLQEKISLLKEKQSQQTKELQEKRAAIPTIQAQGKARKATLRSLDKELAKAKYTLQVGVLIGWR